MRYYVRYQLTAASQIQTRFFAKKEEAEADVALMIGRDKVFFARLYGG